MTDSLKIHRRWHGFFSILNAPDVLFTKSVSSYSAQYLNAVCIVVVLKQQQWWVLLFGLVPPSPRRSVPEQAGESVGVTSHASPAATSDPGGRTRH